MPFIWWQYQSLSNSFVLECLMDPSLFKYSMCMLFLAATGLFGNMDTDEVEADLAPPLGT